MTPTVAPATIDDLATTIAAANAAGERIVPIGGGRRWRGPARRVDRLVSIRTLNRIVEHAAGDMTATVQAGVHFGDLLKLLAEKGQFLPIDAPLDATIGGMIALDDSGSWRYRHGGIRDLLIGVTIVRADGTIARSGGKVVKNVAGYDLGKLFTGTWGTLGCIAEATFRLYPRTEWEQTLSCQPGDRLAAIWEMARALPATGLAVLASETSIQLYVRYNGLHDAVETLAKDAVRLFAQVPHARLDAFDWSGLVPKPARGDALLARIGVLPATVPAAIQAIAAMPRTQAVIHGHGLGWVRVAFPTIETVTALRVIAPNVVVLDAPDPLPGIDRWGYRPDVLALMRRVQRQFDPKGTFCPERIGLDV